MFLWALILYPGLLVFVGNVARFFVDEGEVSVGYVTPLLLFSAIALPAISFFKINGRDFFGPEKHFLFYGLLLSNAALYVVSFWVRFTPEFGDGSVVVLVLSFVFDMAVLNLTLKYFWKLYIYG